MRKGTGESQITARGDCRKKLGFAFGEPRRHSLFIHSLSSAWQRGKDIFFNSDIQSKVLVGFISEPGDEDIHIPGGFYLLSSFYSPWTGMPPRSQK